MTAGTPPGVVLDPWLSGVDRLVGEGFDQLDLLTAVDLPRDGVIEIVIHLVRIDDHADVFGHVRLPRADPVLASVTSILPAAAWHEREIHEMFGVDISGHPDLRPLLLQSASGPPPLRKDTPLVARVETPWPGAVEETTGRRSRRAVTPPGVPPEWLGEGS